MLIAWVIHVSHVMPTYAAVISVDRLASRLAEPPLCFLLLLLEITTAATSLAVYHCWACTQLSELKLLLLLEPVYQLHFFWVLLVIQ